MPGFNVPGGGPARVGAPSSITETARRNRWKLELNFAESNVITIYAHKSERPKPEIDNVTFHHSQEEIYFPGKHRWQPIKISFYETIRLPGDMVARFLYDWWSSFLIQLPRSTINNAPIGSIDPIKYDAWLTLLDGLGNNIHIYHLMGCWPEKISPDDLDYEESAIAEIELTLRFDKCEEVAVPHSRVTIS